MDTNSKRGSMTKAVTICLIAVGLVAGSSLMYSAIVGYMRDSHSLEEQ